MRLPIVVAALLLIDSLGAQAPCPAETADEAAVEVRTSFDAWNQAVLHKDLDRTMAIFSPNLRFQFQGAPDFGFARLHEIYSANFARENAPVWHPIVENLIASPNMVTLFNEWKLIPAAGGDPLSEYRGVDVFQREDDCVWRVTASLNYAEKSVLATNPRPAGPSSGPATVDAATSRPLIASNQDRVVRDLDFVFGHH